jgi:transcription-repair coupling factor (superfamily II helicase)
MLKRLFGNEFAEIVNNAAATGLKNIPTELIPLYTAGINQVSNRNIIWITGENENTDRLKSDLETWSAFLGDTGTDVHRHRLPWEDPYINNSISPESAGEKNRLLAAIRDNKNNNKKMTVITTLAALNIKLERKKDKDLLIKTLAVNDPLPPDLMNTLSELGYHKRIRVAEPGDYSVHGKIMDIFPAGFNYPFRVKFSDTAIDSIKRFHPVSQISIEAVDAITITTTVYFETTKSKHTEILFLSELLEDYLVVTSDYDALQVEYKKLLENFDNMRTLHQESENTEWPAIGEIFTYPMENLERFNLSPAEGDYHCPQLKPENRTFLNLTEEWLSETAAEGNMVLFCCGNGEKENRVQEKFNPQEIIKGDIPLSLYFPGVQQYFISFLGRAYGDTSAHLQQEAANVFDGIEKGDFVVHKTHGIGRFEGFKHLPMAGGDAEFLTIMYQDEAKIYVPVHELDILSKYVGFQGKEPALDKIGGATWDVKKREAKKNMVSFARELLDLYARRKAITGHSFTKKPDAEKAFIKDFSFVETRDQKAAIKDVLSDLEAHYPMDRLICGDVSFGKTEIALRAANRVAACKKQVALLCPTTVLAYQHYSTFKTRFARFPYRVELLSRNVPAPRRKEILQGLAMGEVDMVIGTHALLGKDVAFKDPGLFIIDEEQRFGVFQKEKLKKGREHIDVLSLSATPIPRTLSFTVAGLQDVSVINTAPVGRKAIKNYIGTYCEELMISAIGKEKNRKGQTFLIYNSIEGIYTFRERLRKLMPEIDFGLIHAKMAAEEIEETVLGFINKEADVLISTTIIENGIDIPNVNTLIIIDAHRFGLTQLYQLRGRIGRGTQQAYTYFFHGELSEKADKRLEAIREFSELGSGYKVAEFDLKMRGAGSLLGNKQHGHIEALGFDYFLGLLKKTIHQLKGEETEAKETAISIQFIYSISDSYIMDTQERISVYKRILNAKTASQLLELKEEIEDRYGEIEEDLLKGFFAHSIKILASVFEFEEVELSLDMMEVTLRPVYDDKKDTLSEFIGFFNARITEPTAIIVEYADYCEFMETLLLFLMDIEP